MRDPLLWLRGEGTESLLHNKRDARAKSIRLSTKKRFDAP